MSRNRVGIAVIMICLILDGVVVWHERRKQGRDEITRCVSGSKKLPK